ncbi:MAG: NUDIX hydrolase [Candidatus Micrarchaeia archaeon]
MKVYYKGRVDSLVEESAIVKGKRVRITVIKERDAVTILPLLGNDRILLESQYRPVVRKRLYELPAGHIEKGETPIKAVKRELREEAGYSTKLIRFMFNAYSQPNTVTTMLHFYYAHCYRSGEPEPEALEDINIRIVSLSKALDMIKRNEIRDTKSIAAILYYVNFELVRK